MLGERGWLEAPPAHPHPHVERDCGHITWVVRTMLGDRDARRWGW